MDMPVVNKMPTIEETIAFIRDKAHFGQVDKTGEPYFHHPVAVMKRLPADTDIEVKLAALLHDVLEDSPYTRKDLETMGYSKRTLDIVELVGPKEDKRPYPVKISDIIASGNRDAVLVKHADISENSSEERLVALHPSDRKRLEKKYRKPIRALTLALAA